MRTLNSNLFFYKLNVIQHTEYWHTEYLLDFNFNFYNNQSIVIALFKKKNKNLSLW